MMSVLTLVWLAMTSAQAGRVVPRDAGTMFQGGVGIGGAGQGLTPALQWYAGVSGLWGQTQDDTWMTGWYVAPGMLLRQDIQFADDPLTNGHRQVRTAPMLEMRAGMNLYIAGLWASISGGPLLTSQARSPTGLAGGTVRLAVGLSYRVAVPLALSVRLEGGADLTDRPSGVVGLSLGLEHMHRGP